MQVISVYTIRVKQVHILYAVRGLHMAYIHADGIAEPAEPMARALPACSAGIQAGAMSRGHTHAVLAT